MLQYHFFSFFHFRYSSPSLPECREDEQNHVHNKREKKQLAFYVIIIIDLEKKKKEQGLYN